MRTKGMFAGHVRLVDGWRKVSGGQHGFGVVGKTCKHVHRDVGYKALSAIGCMGSACKTLPRQLPCACRSLPWSANRILGQSCDQRQFQTFQTCRSENCCLTAALVTAFDTE
jgi:hypothetical protein